MSGINWDVELKKIEREFDGLPPQRSADADAGRRAAERITRQRKEGAAAAVGAWVRMALVVALAGGLSFWPYARECGFGLFAYMAADTVVLAGALGVVAFTWRWHMAKTHGAALLMVLGALVLLASQMLPRVGYATPDPRHPQGWRCVAASRP